ncbi:Polyisoprenoid-binding protein YceI [Micromonospora viridifaciens]|uniref:Polyisoprenoid-binding protein YceI n=1 Tax=Micromonospora viridifaciens TaxID=1881 RepID=A0A1C4YV57_MICVI|nr:YceI family protein [Micromonospora viridifaciens]SCF24642.1 Polyisoprenoid-binding protein YceI [Micromonospora viridifaciens]
MKTNELNIPGYTVGTWSINAAHSYVGFVVRHLMVSKVRGRFTQVSGEIITAEDPRLSSVSASIDLASIDTGNEARDEHVRSADFLDVASHPVMSFVSTAVREVDGEFFLDGALTIRGVTRPVTLAVDVPAFVTTNQGARKAGFSATAEINRSDFGVSYNGPVPGGGMAISEKVQIELEIQADLRS